MGYQVVSVRSRRELEQAAKDGTPVSAWELAGDWWWVDWYLIRPVNGRATYEQATITNRENVRVSSLRKGLGQVHRTVSYDAPFILVKVSGGGDA